MPGGFVGVDVFFVISGYLISGIIIKQAQKNKFSYTDFYSRRIKRIYPALLLVLFFVLALAIRVYEKRETILTAKTMAASTIFGANIEILTYEKGYFDPDVKQNPLLHLWSLGVEEQFYIVWPCFITFLFSRVRSSTTLLLSLFTLCSFVFGVIMVYSNSKFAFYFPVCRFWQMSIGGLIVHQAKSFNNQLINNIMSIFGTLSILNFVWVIDEKSLFPGWWALVPTLGSACILKAGPDALVNKYILSSQVFVFIGKISYPLYLWHWPLLVFSRYMYPEGSDSIFANTYFVLFACLALSTLTYYFVENKIRFRKEKIVVFSLLFLMVTVGISCIFIINSPQ
jgi:peptidoglycan/LPS O-acetylase OafA/YrhL